MGKKILLHVEGRLLKGLLLKSIDNMNMGILDIMDIEDMNLKLEAFGSKLRLAIFEITDANIHSIREEISRLKEIAPDTPVLALVTKDTADIVTFATRNGIHDVLYLPKNRELYHKIIIEKMASYDQKWNPKESVPIKKVIVEDSFLDDQGIREKLVLELKHAQRGNYPLTLVMACLTGEEESAKAQSYFQRAGSYLRDTDKLLIMDSKNSIGVFPYTHKDFTLTLEQKFRDAFLKEYGNPGRHTRLYLFSVTYPFDAKSLEEILERLKDGINNSMVIDSIQSPLNSLSRQEIDRVRQKLRQYRKFM